MFEGWDEINPWDYKVNNDLSFTVTKNGEEVYTSHKFRLKAQAEQKAIRWIQQASGHKPNGDVTLDVHNTTSQLAVKWRHNG